MTQMKDLAELVVALGGAFTVLGTVYVVIRKKFAALVTATPAPAVLPKRPQKALTAALYSVTQTAAPRWFERTSTSVVLIILFLALTVANLVVYNNRSRMVRPDGYEWTFDIKATEASTYLVVTGDVGGIDGKSDVLVLARTASGRWSIVKRIDVGPSGTFVANIPTEGELYNDIVAVVVPSGIASSVKQVDAISDLEPVARSNVVHVREHQ